MTQVDFLGSGKYCRWTPDSKLARMARQLSGQTDHDTIREVHRYVTTKFDYDYPKAVDLAGKGGYIPDPERTYETGKGICFDLSSLMCAMLRSLGIPAKLVIGKRNGKLHAWVSAWDGKSWLKCDPTFGAWLESATYEKLEEK